jgi:hypothetical protein
MWVKIWPSWPQNSFFTPIKAKPVFSDAYMTDGVRKSFREAACILAGKHCSVNLFLSIPDQYT